ncbi:MAG: hypothetical protein ACREQI_04340 [Candidatus Binataceae bacterium]
MVSKLPRYHGTAWRAESGYRHRHEVTAADVVRFEQEDLGNEWPKSISPELLAELADYPASKLIWVARTQEIATLYGIAAPIQLSQAAAVVYEDEDGTLVLNIGENVDSDEDGRQW